MAVLSRGAPIWPGHLLAYLVAPLSEPPAWTQPYIGLPFRDGGRWNSPDCYGLGRRVMIQEHQIVLPLYDCYEDSRDTQIIGPMIIGALREPDSPWRKLDWDQRRAFDWVLYWRGESPAHLGVVADQDWALHTFRDAGSGCEQFARAVHRLGFTALECYRHRDLPEVA